MENMPSQQEKMERSLSTKFKKLMKRATHSLWVLKDSINRTRTTINCNWIPGLGSLTRNWQMWYWFPETKLTTISRNKRNLKKNTRIWKIEWSTRARRIKNEWKSRSKRKRLKWIMKSRSGQLDTMHWKSKRLWSKKSQLIFWKIWKIIIWRPSRIWKIFMKRLHLLFI